MRQTTKPEYSETFTRCLRRYAEAHYEVAKLSRSLIKHAVICALALGLCVGSAPAVFTINQLSLYSSLVFICPLFVLSYCVGRLLFYRKQLQTLKTKEFMAYATLDELCIVDLINKSK